MTTILTNGHFMIADKRVSGHFVTEHRLFPVNEKIFIFDSEKKDDKL